MLIGAFEGSDLIIVAIVLVVLGFAPKLARNLGTAKKEFEKSIKPSEAKSVEEPKEDN
jgi:Sec-independent protein translocase protein TatA